MYKLMYYGGLILSITMTAICIVLFFKLSMLEVIDYYFKLNDKYGLNLEKFIPNKKIKNSTKNDQLNQQEQQEKNENITLTANSFEENAKVYLETKKRYSTMLLDDNYHGIDQMGAETTLLDDNYHGIDQMGAETMLLDDDYYDVDQMGAETTLLDDYNNLQQKENEFVLDGVISSNPTTLL